MVATVTETAALCFDDRVRARIMSTLRRAAARRGREPTSFMLRQGVERVAAALARTARPVTEPRALASGGLTRVFIAAWQGRRYRLLARRAGARLWSVISIRRHGTSEAERETGWWAMRLLQQIADRAAQRAHVAADEAIRTGLIRYGQEQVRASGQPVRSVDPSGKPRRKPLALNKPDLSWVYRVGRTPDQIRRLNVEVDTSATESKRHQRVVAARDPRALNVFAVVDPKTGQVSSVTVRPPAGKDGKARKARTYTGARAARLLQRLPRPTR